MLAIRFKGKTTLVAAAVSLLICPGARADQGLGGFKTTQPPKVNTAFSSATPAELEAVGTRKVLQLKAPKGRVVEGPHVLSQESLNPKPRWLARKAHELIIRSVFGMAQGGNLFRWGKPPKLKHRQVKPGEIEQAARSWMPGDLIINGSGGHAGHLMVYMGTKNGVPMVVHSMATQYSQKSVGQYLKSAAEFFKLRARGKDFSKVGVIEEPLGEAFKRIPRDTWYVVRDKTIDRLVHSRSASARHKALSMVRNGLATVRGAIGKKYDYDLASGNKGIYCSELAAERFIVGAYRSSGLKLPWIGTTHVKAAFWPIRLKTLVGTPQNFSVSPDFAWVDGNKPGRRDFIHNHKTHVVGSRRAGSMTMRTDLGKMPKDYNGLYGSQRRPLNRATTGRPTPRRAAR
jgi:hypothetical protein